MDGQTDMIFNQVNRNGGAVNTIFGGGVSIENMMRHRVNVWRVAMAQHTAQEIDGYSLVGRNLPCFIQPVDSKEAFWWQERGLENTHNVYTSQTCFPFKRNDILQYGDRQFHVVGRQERRRTVRLH